MQKYSFQSNEESGLIPKFLRKNTGEKGLGLNVDTCNKCLQFENIFLI